MVKQYKVGCRGDYITFVMLNLKPRIYSVQQSQYHNDKLEIHGQNKAGITNLTQEEFVRSERVSIDTSR